MKNSLYSVGSYLNLIIPNKIVVLVFSVVSKHHPAPLCEIRTHFEITNSMYRIFGECFFASKYNKIDLQEGKKHKKNLNNIVFQSVPPSFSAPRIS